MKFIIKFDLASFDEMEKRFKESGKSLDPFQSRAVESTVKDSRYAIDEARKNAKTPGAYLLYQEYFFMAALAEGEKRKKQIEKLAKRITNRKKRSKKNVSK